MTKMTSEDFWRAMVEEGIESLHRERWLFRRLPSDPRCKVCSVPFGGFGGRIMGRFGYEPWIKNPNLCNLCQDIVMERPGGAEVNLSLLFADVRGSTDLAETLSPMKLKQVMSSFYEVATSVLVRTNAFVDKIVADEVVGFYFPAFHGPLHAGAAIRAADELIRRAHSEEVLPLGIGVHTGIVYLGTIGGEGGVAADIGVVGDVVNTTARLASSAAQGEVFISEQAHEASDLDLGELERRELALKGKAEPFPVRVLTIHSPGPERAERATAA
ncbi:MAG: adenylate/guanylate cyclase domain-containing protein [Candidatus Methylomirabilales bacterium]